MADEKELQVALSWQEPISKLGITDDMLQEALQRGVREHILDSPEMMAKVSSAIKHASQMVSEVDVAAALKDDMVEILKQKVADQNKELVQCLRDYTAFRGMYASDYIQRRYKELHDKVEEFSK